MALNGFVQDVFEETAVALVRSLRTVDETGRIEISIGPGGDAESSEPTQGRDR